MFLPDKGYCYSFTRVRLVHVALYMCMSVTLSIVYGQIIVDQSSGSEVTVDVGDDVTLVCDLSNVGNEAIYWYVVELRDYISNNENIIEAPLPESDINDYSIGYDKFEGQFNLTIKNVRTRDARTYKCVYYTGLLSWNRNSLITTKLTVLSAPSADSPYCSAIPTKGTSENYGIGDTIRLICSADGGSPVPNLSWYRNKEFLKEGSGYISVVHTLGLGDINVVFSCLMTTSALDLSGNCSEIPLKSVDYIVTVSQYITSPPSISNTVSSQTEKQTKPIGETKSIASTNTPVGNQDNMQSLIIIVAAAGAGFILLVIAVAIIIVLVCCLKKKGNKAIPKPMNRPATSEYEMVTPQEPDFGVVNLKPSEVPESQHVVTAVQPPSIPLEEYEQSPDQGEFPVYAQPHSHKTNYDINNDDTKKSRVHYENVNVDEKQLVYADLQLNEDASDDIIQTDEPTLYVKVKV